MKKQFLKFIAVLFSFYIPTAVNATNPGDIVITEIMANPDAVPDATGEWFEIMNVTSSTIDIEGWRIKDDGTDDHIITNGGPLYIDPGEILVLANNGNSTSNGGITPAYVYSGVTLGNSGDEIILLDPQSEEIDKVTYSGAATGKSLSLDPNHVDATDNDDPAFWCLASSVFGMGDYGTPGSMNGSCNINILTPSGNGHAISLFASDNNLLVRFPKKITRQEWRIMDITGKTVLSGTTPENDNRFLIQLDEVNAGLYFFRLSGTGSAIRFIVN